MSREERLAARLRENLHRRKAQARALASAPELAESDERGETGGVPPGLPKPPPAR